jgi:LEA14-like dessication related protein
MIRAMKMIGLSTAFLTFIALAGCSVFIKEPRVAFKGTSLTGVDSSGLDMEFLLAVTNPNSFDLSLTGYSYDLHVLAIPLSSGETQQTIHFPARAETDMHLPVHLSFNNLLEIIKHQPDLNELPYRVNARLKLKSLLGESFIQIEQNDTLNVPEPYRPGAALKRLQDALRGRL